MAQHHVFENRAETAGRGVDFRFGFGRKLDRLGVAAAFEVEDAVLAPAMLVIADQRARRIGRQRGLAGAGQAEEHGGITFWTDIGRAMHGHDALGRQEIIEDCEDRLLVFTGIGGAADEDKTIGEIAGDDGFRTNAVTVRIGLEARQVDDGELLFETRQFFLLRSDKKVANEQRMPGKLGDDAGRQSVFLIGAADQVLNIEGLSGGMGQHVLAQQLEIFRRQRLVVVPPDGVLGGGIADDEFVLRRTARMLAGDGAKRTIDGQFGLAVADRFFV
ncbi:hypothetical protein D3C72_1405380 [compost metagenome]